MDKLEINQERGASILKVQGDVEGDDGFHLLEIVNNAEEGSLPFWIMDIPETQFFDSMALEAILRISRTLRERKGDIYITSATPNVQEIFRITRLQSKFKFFSNINQALENLFKGQSGGQ